MTATERFLRYIAISSPSEENSNATPSTDCQFDMAQELRAELEKMGFQDVRLTDNCFVYGVLPATPGMEELPSLGLIAHIDTAPAFNGIGVKPQIHQNYDGKDVLLPGSGAVLSPRDFPQLAGMKGKTLITTDGTTLLGADDKAGVAEILTACEQVIASGQPHGKIVVAFTPDEEIGTGVHSFDVEGFGADYAFTVDGGPMGEISFENFNACEATVECNGVSVHPGSSKDTMINAILLAMEFNSMLPSLDIPRETIGYQGFFHLESIQGDVSHTTMMYIIRDHNPLLFEHRKAAMEHIADAMNQKWGEGRVVLRLREQYRNMREIIEKHMEIIEMAQTAMEKAGIQYFYEPTRGGTDGAQLCYMGLPCPNLCTCGYAFHGPFEHICAEDMEKCAEMLKHLLLLPRKNK